mgnify:CR=1 FL=1
MKTLSLWKLGGLCLLAVAMSACFIVPDSNDGTFTVSWSVTQAGAPVACADAGAAYIMVSATDPNQAASTFIFPCSDGTGVTQGQGQPALQRDVEYSLAWAVLDVDQQPLNNVSGPPATPVLLDQANVVVPPAVFDFAPVGPSIFFQIDYEAGVAGTNCGVYPPDPNDLTSGQGVEWQETALYADNPNSAYRCESSVLGFDGNPMHCGINGDELCTPCLTNWAGCQESGAVQRISGNILPDTYRLEIRAYVDCDGPGPNNDPALCYYYMTPPNVITVTDVDVDLTTLDVRLPNPNLSCSCR